jgi:chemotaxis protein methyltransferase CheR
MDTLARAQPITDGEFRRIRDWFYQRAGIHLSDQKKALVCGRLSARLRHHHLSRYGDYFDLLHEGSSDESQIALDLLTTNETSFFREPKHFDFLRERIAPRHTPSRPFRAWSAGCSTGEEPYSIGMTLASCLGASSWEVLGSDLSSRVLERARRAIYPMDRARTLPRADLHAHCLKGTGQYDGTFQVGPHVTSRVAFRQLNLNAALPAIGEFELIFLRNVMIYFEPAIKQHVINRVLACLRPGGHLMIGHAESLAGVNSVLQLLAPSVYRKP